ncbi:MAG: hypothetical protein RR825_04500, partial [Ruthenibacterium sp.]
MAAQQSLSLTRTTGIQSAADELLSLSAMAQAVAAAGESAQRAAHAQQAMTRATISVTRALKTVVAGFDELHLAAQDIVKTDAAKRAAAKKAAAAKKG